MHLKWQDFPESYFSGLHFSISILIIKNNCKKSKELWKLNKSLMKIIIIYAKEAVVDL